MAHFNGQMLRLEWEMAYVRPLTRGDTPFPEGQTQDPLKLIDASFYHSHNEVSTHAILPNLYSRLTGYSPSPLS